MAKSKAKRPAKKKVPSLCPPKPSYTNEAVIAALEANDGYVFAAAQQLGCSRVFIYKRAEEVPAVREAIIKRKSGGKSEDYVFSNEVMIAALEEANGLVSQAAAALGCKPNTIYYRVKKCPEVKESWLRKRDEFVDKAEHKLREAVDTGDMKAICYTLSCLGKRRGYGIKKYVRVGGDKNAPPIMTKDQSFGFDELPLALREQILDFMLKKEKESTNGQGRLTQV